MPICMIIGAPPASIVYGTNTGSLTDPVTNTSWSFPGCSIGPAASDRLVIVGTFYFNTATTAASCTIGGIAATEVTGCHVRSSSGIEIRLFKAVVPTGTTATVVVNTGTATGCYIGVWSAYDLISTTAVDSSVHAPSAGSTIILDLNVSAGGVVCAMGITPNAVSWTGLTEDYDRINSVWQSGASDAFTGAASPQAVRVNTAPGTGAVMCAVSFR